MKYFRVKTILPVFFLANITAAQAELVEPEYQDFSTDRATWFFKVTERRNNTVFSDFFFPFDPTLKTGTYDPLISYELEDSYYFNSDDKLMMNLDDLKKLYAPYFDYEIEDNTLSILYTNYEKKILSGVGQRSTTLQYTQKEWLLDIDLGDLADTEYTYTQYESVTGTRNRAAVFTDEIDIQNDGTIELAKGDVKRVRGEYFVAAAELMENMGKTVFINEGYLHIQSTDLADITVATEFTSEEDLIVPNAENQWHGGIYETVADGYSWADYMNSILRGRRDSGWMWQSFYIPSGDHFVDQDGNEVTLEADRIIPFNIYVPTNYNRRKSRMVFMLHGGTGNENTATYRAMVRDQHIVPIDEYAEEYNYVLVSPNGWTQNPLWRQEQAFYSFNKAAEMAMDAFPVRDDRVFITGNSMGGKGTLEIVMRKPDTFRAMAPTAMKIVSRDSNKNNYINIEETVYDLSSVSHIPTFAVTGVADSTTSYKTQIGNPEAPGGIVSAVMPKLDDATYVAVEQGSHAYSYSSLIVPIFDFFESTLDSHCQFDPYSYGIDRLASMLEYAQAGIAYWDYDGFHNFYAKKVERFLNYSWTPSCNRNNYGYHNRADVKIVEGTVMVGIETLENFIGSEFKAYDIYSYDSAPDESVEYFTILLDNQAVNFFVGELAYRKNMERYSIDANALGGNRNTDAHLLEDQPEFAVAPFEEDGVVYVPALELLTALSE